MFVGQGFIRWWGWPLSFVAGLVVGNVWTYSRYYDVPRKTLAALEERRLEWQARAPLIRTGGWLNAPSGKEADVDGKVLLVDVWAEWCDPCMESMPGLVDLHERFKDRVVFIGVTAGEQDAAEEYVRRFQVDWPVGYDLSPETMRQLGGGGPLLYIVGRDGRVFWYDDRARLQHKTDQLWSRVAQELELALAARD